MPETIYVGYVKAVELERIADIVESVLQRERMTRNEESPIDRLAHNVRVLRRRASRPGHAAMGCE